MAELNYSKKRIQPIITKYGIDVENDKVFQAVITLFPGQTDYQLWGLKVVFGKAATLDRLIAIKEWADANPTEISHLSKQNLVSYKTSADIQKLNDEMESLDAVMVAKRVISRFNTDQRHILTEGVINRVENKYDALRNRTFKEFFHILKDFETLPMHRQQKFISLMSAVRGLGDIKHHLTNALQETYEWNREDMLSYAQRNCPDTEVCFDQNNVVVLRIPSFESSEKLCGHGRTSWCLTRESGYFRRYTQENQNAQQFFLFDFNKKENHELAHVGFSVNPQKGINYAHSTRNNTLMSNLTVDGRSWTIHDVLDACHISKNVYIRLKPLRNYKWNKESFLNFIAERNISAKQIDDNRFIVETPNQELFSAVADHILVGNHLVQHNVKVFLVFDFSKDLNDDKSILVFTFAKDKYESISFNSMFDAYGVKSTSAGVLGVNHLTSDMFVDAGNINPNILLHKLIDEKNTTAAIKLLEENKDVDPNMVFFGSLPAIKAITDHNIDLFKALASHSKFDMNITEAFGEPFIQFIVLYMETLVDDKNADLAPFFEMCDMFINNDKYNINALDLNGDSALHVACEMAELSPLVERLVANPKCDVNMKNEWGFTPLDVALDNSLCNTKAIEALLSREDLKIGDKTEKFAKEKGVDLAKMREKCMAARKEASEGTIKTSDRYAEIFAKAFKK